MARRRRFAHITAVLTVFALAVGLSGCGWVSTVPALEERAKSAWSEVHTQDRRRVELIPFLVEALRGFSQQEREVVRQVTDARAKAVQVEADASIITDPHKFREYQEVQNQLSAALARLFVTVERYPELKSNSNFLALQSQLQSTEARIAVARRDYAAAARAHNRELRRIPGRWIAAIFHPEAKPIETFTANPGPERPGELRF